MSKQRASSIKSDAHRMQKSWRCCTTVASGGFEGGVSKGCLRGKESAASVGG